MFFVVAAQAAMGCTGFKETSCLAKNLRSLQQRLQMMCLNSKNLAGVHDAVRVEHGLERFHVFDLNR